MKFLLSFLAAIVIFHASAQPKIRYDENSIVKDTTGFVYPSSIWQPLVTKGSHTLKAEDPNNPKTAFYIVKASEADKEIKFAKMPRPPESRSFKTGQKVKLPDMVDIDGKQLAYKDLQGKIVVLNFWFINCRPCRMEIPDLNELVAKYRSKDNLVFIAIALDKKHDIERFLELSPFAYSIIEEGVFLAQQFGVQSFPTHAIINTDGKVHFQTAGLAENTIYWLKKSIDELLMKADKSVAAN